MPDWLETLSIVALVASFISSLIVLADILLGRRQKMAIMNVVWPLTGLYLGPVGLWAYWVMGRPMAMSHDKEQGDQHEHGGDDQGEGEEHEHQQGDEHKPEKPFWQTVFVGTTHCGAGCTLGDFIAEWGVFLLGVTLFSSILATNFLFDYLLAFLAGILFQYFSIVPMRNLSPGEGILAAVKADALSLTAFEVGMFGWMALARFVLFAPRPPEPNTAVYWFSMQIAMFVGFLTSYPANWFLIRKGIKEAM